MPSEFVRDLNQVVANLQLAYAKAVTGGPAPAADPSPRPRSRGGLRRIEHRPGGVPLEPDEEQAEEDRPERHAGEDGADPAAGLGA